MTEEVKYVIGAEASCTDGTCGEVTRIVIDPVGQEITHLVVEPKHRRGLGRHVPLDLVDATGGEVRLGCTLAGFDELDRAEETEFLPGSTGFADYGSGEVMSWPYYGVGANMTEVSKAITYDAVPLGEVEVRRGEEVHATDGPVGKVQGLTMDRQNRHVTHVLLQEGHLWGRRQVAVPIGAVVGTDDGIRLNLSKHDVEALPPVEVDQ